MNEFKNKKYLTLLFDAVELYSLAEKCEVAVGRTLYRSAIIAAVVSLESVANICMDSLKLPSEIYSQIEKFNIPSKFEYFSYAAKGVSIEKSRNEYSLLRSIVSIRNDYVHPKVEEGKVSNDGEHICYGYKKVQELPNDIRLWGKSEAKFVLEANIEFLNYFFLSLCGFDAGLVTTLIGCHEEFGNKMTKSFLVVGKRYDLLDRLGVKIKYLDIRRRVQT